MQGDGFFVQVRPLFGRGVRWFGYVYLAAMVLRYIIHMSLYPEARWFGGAIPIVFHWVLASFIIAFGEYHRGQLTQSSRLGRVNTNGHFYEILRTWKSPTLSIAKSSRACRRHAAT